MQIGQVPLVLALALHRQPVELRQDPALDIPRLRRLIYQSDPIYGIIKIEEKNAAGPTETADITQVSKQLPEAFQPFGFLLEASRKQAVPACHVQIG